MSENDYKEFLNKVIGLVNKHFPNVKNKVEEYINNFESQYEDGLTRDEIIEICKDFSIDEDKMFNELTGQTGVIAEDGTLLNFRGDVLIALEKLILGINRSFD